MFLTITLRIQTRTYMRKKKDAIKKRKIKRSYKSKHKDRDAVRQTPKTSRSHSPIELKKRKNKKKGLVCFVCGEPVDINDNKKTIKYSNELYFYYCSCSLNTLPLHIKKDKKEN